MQELGLRNTTVVGIVTVEIGETFPRNESGKVRGVLGCDSPLYDGEIRHSDHTNFAVRPRQSASPFNTVVTITAFLLAEDLEVTLRSPRAATVTVDNSIALLGPHHRIDAFPDGIFRNPALRDTGARENVESLRAVLAVRTESEDDRKLAGNAFGAENIHVDFYAVVHGNRHVPSDLHAIRNLFFVGDQRRAGCVFKGNALLPVERLHATWVLAGDFHLVFGERRNSGNADGRDEIDLT